MKFSIIVATGSNGEIGRNGGLPWHFSSDMKFFKSVTHSPNHTNAIVMGRKTFESLPKPLPGRKHYVLSSSSKESSGDVMWFTNWEDLLHQLRQDYWRKTVKDVFFIGGQSIFEYGMSLGPDSIYHTFVDATFEGCDSFFDMNQFLANYQQSMSVQSVDKGMTLHFKKYERIGMHPEMQYLKLAEKILYTGHERQTRNAITYSLFSEKIEFDIRDSFPLLTTKKVFLKGIIEELIWFIRGDTNAKHLNDKGVKIWNGNSTREYLDSIGLHDYKEFDCGPVYGFQWRHFNATYHGCEEDYTGMGVDQFGEVIRLLKYEPYSRRIIFSGWNPAQASQMVLPPCHLLYHFYVNNHNELECQMYQRSADFFLGVPFNIASVAIMTYILAHYTGHKPGKISIVFGDCHVYKDHIDAIKTQISRIPKEFPKLRLINMPDNIEELKYENFLVENYNSHPAISAKMIA